MRHIKHMMVVLIAGVALGHASDAAASAFRVTPISVDFPGKSSTLLSLTNESKETLRFQISAFAWKQGPAGDMQLETTQDISFFPALLTLAAGEERKVRVGSNVPAGPVEKTYRIFFEELPPAQKPAQKQSEVRILTKMGIPIFVRPANPNPAPKVSTITTEGGQLVVNVENAGNAHYAIQKVRVRGTSGTGDTLFERDLDGWYVLAGGLRTYRIDVPAEACAQLRAAKVEVTTDITKDSRSTPSVTAEQTFTVGANCR